jgi:hypothetical protein
MVDATLKCACVVIFLTCALAGNARAQPLRLHTAPLPVKSYRLLSMSMDDEGYIWVGSIHRVIHRYDPRTGSIETLPLPFDSSTSACICAGRKVYLLGQSYPKLMIYHRDEKRFSEHAYPSDKPDVWYGTEAGDGRHLYLFDRGSAGIIKWDAQQDTGRVIAYPYKTSLPTSGRYEPRDGGIWCYVWDIAGGRYIPIGIARLDARTDQFTGWYPFPNDDATLQPYSHPDATFFIPYTLKGKIVPFDFRAKRFCKFLDVPRYGERFGFLAGPTEHKGRLYFSISTYNGTDTGCDGKPYHFCNGLLEFDPRARTFDFPTLDAGGAYYQIAYTLSAGGEFYATGVNILQPDGTLKQTEAGQAVFWQTREPDKAGKIIPPTN